MMFSPWNLQDLADWPDLCSHGSNKYIHPINSYMDIHIYIYINIYDHICINTYYHIYIYRVFTCIHQRLPMLPSLDTLRKLWFLDNLPTFFLPPQQDGNRVFFTIINHQDLSIKHGCLTNKICYYHLVICYIATEKCHRNSWFTPENSMVIFQSDVKVY